MNRQILRLFFALPTLLWMAGCGGGRQPADRQPQPLAYGRSSPAIQFVPVRFLRESAACATDETHCARVRAEYPAAVLGAPAERAFFNDTLEAHVRRSFAVFPTGAEEPPPSLGVMADRLLADYEKYADDMGAYQTPWEVSLAGEVLFQSSRIISVALDNYSYLGGAHPNTSKELLNFDLSQRRLLTLEDICTDRNRLRPLVEARFREFHQLPRGTDLNQAGFFWDQTFFLPANFALTAQGLYLYYNSYEAAPYAVGPTELTIPWPELEGIAALPF